MDNEALRLMREAQRTNLKEWGDSAISAAECLLKKLRHERARMDNEYTTVEAASRMVHEISWGVANMNLDQPARIVGREIDALAAARASSPLHPRRSSIILPARHTWQADAPAPLGLRGA